MHVDLQRVVHQHHPGAYVAGSKAEKPSHPPIFGFAALRRGIHATLTILGRVCKHALARCAGNVGDVRLSFEIYFEGAPPAIEIAGFRACANREWSYL
jgi:hypothetical protein